VFEPDAGATIDAALLEHRHKLTPYDGMRVRGIVRETYLRGEKIYDAGEFADARGRLLRS
jgi:allantoinase